MVSSLYYVVNSWCEGAGFAVCHIAQNLWNLYVKVEWILIATLLVTRFEYAEYGDCGIFLSVVESLHCGQLHWLGLGYVVGRVVSRPGHKECGAESKDCRELDALFCKLHLPALKEVPAAYCNYHHSCKHKGA